MSPSSSSFSGIWIPLVTPFAGGRVDHASLRRLIGSCAEAGVAGFVALGTTGEPSSLDEAERDAVLATVLQAADGLPVVAGLAGNNTAELRERTLRLNELGLAGLLVPAPYYVRPSQAGLAAHFAALADASRHPLVIYDVPYRTGVRLEIGTLLQLAGHPNIAAVKDCSGCLDTLLALLRDGRLAVLAGEDLNLFNTLCLGGHGAIAAAAHLRTADFVAVHRAVRDGRVDEARRVFLDLAPLVQAVFAEPNPGPVKAGLALDGWMNDEVRAPLTPASDGLRRRLEALLAGGARCTA